MQIGGDISTNKCDQCNSFLVWQEFVDHNHQDQSQLEEVCEECATCQTCDGLGLLLSNNKENIDEIQRCDECQIFTSDSDAQTIVFNWYKKKQKEEV